MFSKKLNCYHLPLETHWRTWIPLSSHNLFLVLKIKLKHFASIQLSKGSSLDIKVQTLWGEKRNKETPMAGCQLLANQSSQGKLRQRLPACWNLCSCLQHKLGPPRPKWTGIWRNAQTMENIRALHF